MIKSTSVTIFQVQDTVHLKSAFQTDLHLCKFKSEFVTNRENDYRFSFLGERRNDSDISVDLCRKCISCQ